MLSIGKVGGGNGDPRYYTESVAKGRDDYYTGHGEAEGEWLGQGAAQRKLTGTVSEEAFIDLLTGEDSPVGKVLAYDLTFSAPKSVSVLYGVAEPEVSRAVRDAHDEAVRQALAYLERHACWTRRGRGGRIRLPGDGLVVAAFRHRTSRAGDPQLHTHSVVANATRAEGRWTALDGRALFAHARTAGFLYQAALRAELTRTIGLEWGPVERGVADIRGIDDDVLKHFSRRSEEIRDHLARRGARSPDAARIAALETRRAKQYDVPVMRLREEWRARASELGFDTEAIAEVLDRRVPGRPCQPDLLAEAGVMGSPQGVTREASTFDRRDVIRDWASAHQEGADVERIEALADRWLKTPNAVALEAAATGRAGGKRYSTPEMMAIERTLLDDAKARVGEGVGLVEPKTVEGLVGDSLGLADEQAEMINTLTGSGDGVQVVRAAAGSGKTYALAVARDAWEAEGHHVYGCALAARAAVELESHSGIDSVTIARLRNDLAHGHALPSGSVLVVDEAGMVGTRALAELAEHMNEVEGKLVLVGDDRQLPELDAGGAFRVLANELPSVQLQTVRRQEHEWDRQALGALREGRVEEWADAYREQGRIVARKSATEVREALVTDWWQAAREPGCDAVMIAHRRADVAQLNVIARDRMREDDRLSEEQLVADGRAFAVGDRVLTRRNDRRREVVNGTRGVVVEIDPDTRHVTVELADGERRELDAAYLDEGHLDHAYAVTAHAAQGATVDRSFVLGSDDLYREWAYTALSRHRTEARFYVVSPGSAERCLPGLEPDPDPLARDLTDAIGDQRGKELAAEVLERGLGKVAVPQPRRLPAATNDQEVVQSDSRQRADQLRERAGRLPVWKRRERIRLHKIADRYEEAATMPRTQSSGPTMRGNDLTSDPLDLRRLFVEQPADLTQRIGGRPDGLFEREEWVRAATGLAGFVTADELEADPLPTTSDTGLEI